LQHYDEIDACIFDVQVLLIQRKLQDAGVLMNQARASLDQWMTTSLSQKESIKVFFLVLQVCHYLLSGQVSKCVNIKSLPITNSFHVAVTWLTVII
jgi:MAternally affected uncoordination